MENGVKILVSLSVAFHQFVLDSHILKLVFNLFNDFINQKLHCLHQSIRVLDIS